MTSGSTLQALPIDIRPQRKSLWQFSAVGLWCQWRIGNIRTKNSFGECRGHHARTRHIVLFRDNHIATMKRRLGAVLALCLFFLTACVHSLTMHSRDGQRLSGRYRFARDDSGLIQVTGAEGEVFRGSFVRVARSAFVENYEKIFGRGSIAVFEPELGGANPFAGVFGSSSTLLDSAYGESFDRAPGKSEMAVRGPLFYWTASLGGDRGTTMRCYLIGSSYTGHGFGKCKSDEGHEYSVEF